MNEKKRSGQPVTIPDYIGHLLGATLLKDVSSIFQDSSTAICCEWCARNKGIVEHICQGYGCSSCILCTNQILPYLSNR